jgi:hypothetical protein
MAVLKRLRYWSGVTMVGSPRPPPPKSLTHDSTFLSLAVSSLHRLSTHQVNVRM